MNDDEREFLRAVVACWLSDPMRPVDGANDPRQVVDGHDWFSATETSESLVDAGYLKWANGGLRLKAVKEGSNYSLVVPTPKGIFEALS